MSHRKLTVCVDLNGVLDKFSGWTGKYEDYPVREDAADLLAGLQALQYRVVVFTARTNLEGVNNWLSENELEQYVDEVTNIKPPAHVYIDDRAIQFNGDVHDVLKQIIAFKPHWQK